MSRRYRPINNDRVTDTKTCPDCGCHVADRRAHDRWHAQIAEGGSRAVTQGYSAEDLAGLRERCVALIRERPSCPHLDGKGRPRIDWACAVCDLDAIWPVLAPLILHARGVSDAEDRLYRIACCVALVEMGDEASLTGIEQIKAILSEAEEEVDDTLGTMMPPPEVLARHRGLWVACRNNQVVASGESIHVVCDEAGVSGENPALVFQVPREGEAERG